MLRESQGQHRSSDAWLAQLRKFRRHLGGHRGYRGVHQKHLTLPELGAMVVTVGRDAGFRVSTETACGKDGKHRIDCAWFVDGRDAPAVVWEFDARDVPSTHLIGRKARRGRKGRRGTFQKLREFPDAIRVQALYTIRREVKRKKSYMHTKKFHRALKEGGVVWLYSDRQLIAGALERIVYKARAKVDRRRRLLEGGSRSDTRTCDQQVI